MYSQPIVIYDWNCVTKVSWLLPSPKSEMAETFSIASLWLSAVRPGCAVCTQKIQLSIHLSIHLSIYPSIHLSIYKFIYPSIHQYIYQSIYLSIYLFIYPFIHLYIYPSMNSSIHLSIYIYKYLLICHGKEWDGRDEQHAWRQVSISPRPQPFSRRRDRQV